MGFEVAVPGVPLFPIRLKIVKSSLTAIPDSIEIAQPTDGAGRYKETIILRDDRVYAGSLDLVSRVKILREALWHVQCALIDPSYEPPENPDIIARALGTKVTEVAK